MEKRIFSLNDICISIPTVSYDLSVEELKRTFEELKIYNYLTVLKDGKPIGLVYKEDIENVSNKNLFAGELLKTSIKLRNFSSEREGLIGIIELLPIIKEPIIITDKKGNYLGVLTYEVLLHYFTKYKEYVIPLIQHVRKSLGKEVFLYIFGIKNLSGFKGKFGYEKTRGLIKILREDIQETFKGEVEEIADKEEIWLLTKEIPEKEKIKSLFEEFHKEYTVLFADFPDATLYGMCLDLQAIQSQEILFKKIKEMRERALKIHGYVFLINGIQPRLILYDPRKKKILKNIKEKIAKDFHEIVGVIRKTSKDLWELTLYDMFKVYPYFELFYIISSSGLQISNNIVNPHVNYFVAQGKKGTDRSERPYFKETMEKGFFISEIYLSKATDDFCITVAEKIEYEGKTYIIAGDINFKEIHRLIREEKGATL